MTDHPPARFVVFSDGSGLAPDAVAGWRAGEAWDESPTGVRQRLVPFVDVYLRGGQTLRVWDMPASEVVDALRAAGAVMGVKT